MRQYLRTRKKGLSKGYMGVWTSLAEFHVSASGMSSMPSQAKPGPAGDWGLGTGDK